MRLGDFVNDNKEMFCNLVKVGAVSPTLIERADIYAEVREQYCNGVVMEQAVTNVSENRKISESTTWRALAFMKRELPKK